MSKVRNGVSWTPEEKKQLLYEFVNLRLPLEEIASRHERSYMAIVTRLEVMHLMYHGCRVGKLRERHADSEECQTRSVGGFGLYQDRH